jgi:hypothetical protein
VFHKRTIGHRARLVRHLSILYGCNRLEVGVWFGCSFAVLSAA